MNTRGSAVVETAIAAGLAAALLSASVALGRLALDRRRAHAVSRYAAELAASGLTIDVVNSEVGDYAAAMSLAGATVSTARFTGLPSAGFYRLRSAQTRASSGRWTWTDQAVLEEE